MIVLGCSCTSCTDLKNKVAGLFGSDTSETEASVDESDKAFETKKLSFVKKCGDVKGYKSD